MLQLFVTRGMLGVGEIRAGGGQEPVEFLPRSCQWLPRCTQDTAAAIFEPLQSWHSRHLRIRLFNTVANCANSFTLDCRCFLLCYSLSFLVLDMARHVPLYRALLELLRAIASCTSMVPLLLPLSGENGEEEEEQLESQASVGTLLAKMKTCVDTYTNRLRYTLSIF